MDSASRRGLQVDPFIGPLLLSHYAEHPPLATALRLLIIFQYFVVFPFFSPFFSASTPSSTHPPVLSQKIDVRMGFAFIEFEDRRDAEDAVSGETTNTACHWVLEVLLCENGPRLSAVVVVAVGLEFCPKHARMLACSK